MKRTLLSKERHRDYSLDDLALTEEVARFQLNSPDNLVVVAMDVPKSRNESQY
jgi:hypothetical protein